MDFGVMGDLAHRGKNKILQTQILGGVMRHNMNLAKALSKNGYRIQGGTSELDNGK